MLSAIAAVCLLPAQDAPNPAKLISDMISRYYEAKTLAGTIVKTETAAGQQGSLYTTIQYERPGKLYILQEKRTSNPMRWLVTADGKRFSYDEPARSDPSPRDRIVESMKPRDTITGAVHAYTIKEVYAAATLSLGDRSAVLDIAIGRDVDLRAVRAQWANIQYLGKVDTNGESLHVIGGGWKEYGDAPISGTFRLALTEQGDIRQYIVTERVRIGTLGEQDVVSTWNVALKRDVEVNQNLFQLVLR